MVKVDHSIVVAAPPARVFDLLADPLRFPGLLSAFPRVELVSEQGRCRGARYFMVMQVGRLAAGSVQRLTEFARPRRMAFESESGIELRGALSIEPRDAGRCELRVTLEYRVPGLRLPALVVECATRHIVDRQVRGTLLSVRRLAEFELDDDGGVLRRPSAVSAERPTLAAPALSAGGGITPPRR